MPISRRHEAHQAPFLHYRNGADAPLEKEPRDFPYGGIGPDGNDGRGHDVAGVHGLSVLPARGKARAPLARACDLLTASKHQGPRLSITILVAVDGSKPAGRAVKHVVALQTNGLAFRVLLLNVQPAWAPARSRQEKREGTRLHLEATERTTRRAKSLLDRAGIPWKSALRIGAAAENILRLARDKRCDQIVMGTRGRGAVAGILLGSVAMKVLQFASVPVTLVK